MKKTFKQEIIDLLKEMLLAALEAGVSLFKDLKSFRNRLITYVCLIGLIALVFGSQPGAQVAIITIIGTVVSYYFKQRNDSKAIEKDKEDK